MTYDLISSGIKLQFYKLNNHPILDTFSKISYSITFKCEVSSAKYTLFKSIKSFSKVVCAYTVQLDHSIRKYLEQLSRYKTSKLNE